MKNWIVIVMMILPWGVFAQQGKIVTIEGKAQVEYPDNKSKLEVEKEAEDLAIINALENAFGRAVIESNSTYLKNITTGEKVETSTTFNMVANTLVKGEVIDIKEKKCDEIPGLKIIDGKKIAIKDYRCSVTILAREISETQPEFETYPMACIHVKCKSTSFKDQDPLYLYFKSPSSGFLTVFLDDGKKSQRLLPYQGMTGTYEDGVPIKADTEYYLFSNDKKLDYFENSNRTDEYILLAETPYDQNRMFIVFSTTPIPKPGLREGLGREVLTDYEKKEGWNVPKALSSEEFQRWLIYNRMHNKNISVKISDITIAK